MEALITLAQQIRSRVTRFVRPASSYWLAKREVKPLSRKFGFDRGTPIDRFWIDAFIRENASAIGGKVLEIGDNRYTKAYGGHRVTKSDVLDIDPKNKRATILGDLRNLRGTIASNTYDCLVLTHVLGMVDDIEAAISECYRILKPGGILLVTVSSISPAHGGEYSIWRLTVAAATYFFGKVFPKHSLDIRSYGNVLAGQAFWVGMSQEEFSPAELAYNDPEYPCIVTVKGTKKV